MTALVLRGDARALPLPDASVDLIVTSPPYFGLRSYEDNGEHYDGQIGAEATPAEFVGALIECTREWMRVLKPSGSIFVNLGDSYYSAKGASTGQDAKSGARRFGVRALDRPGMGYPRKTLLLIPERYRIACLDELGLTVRAVMIWNKPNSIPEAVTDRVRRSHEDWVHLTMQPRYFSAIDEIREPASGYFRKPGTARAPGVKPRGMDDSCNPLGRVPGSVWEIPTDPLLIPSHLGAKHFASFPLEWPRRIIQAWSPAAGFVLDPFGGTGSTALVADALGRTGISVDRSADYCRIAQWRTSDPAQRAKAMRLPTPPVVAAGQASLFDDQSAEGTAA